MHTGSLLFSSAGVWLRDGRTGKERGEMSNYPPGVTGNEYEIAGPDYERESDVLCPTCLEKARTMEQGFRGERWLVCEDGHVTDLEPAEGPDPDRAYDEVRERKGGQG